MMGHIASAHLVAGSGGTVPQDRRVLIQHAQDTGLFHAAVYVCAPFGGPMMPGRPERYRADRCDEQGFAALEDAQARAEVLALRLGIGLDAGQVREVSSAAGADSVTISVVLTESD